MTERPDTRDERLLDLYRRAPRPEPPARLDAAIRGAAREAVRRPHRRWGGFPALATAAVLVLAVGLVVQQTKHSDLAEVEHAPESAPREAPRPSAAVPAPRVEQPAPRPREFAPAVPPAAGTAVPRLPAVEKALESRARQALTPLAAESAADRLDAAACPPLPPELAADRGLLEQRIAALLEQGETHAAECLRRAAALDGPRPGAEQ
jgi:hypothetical protein